MGKFSFGDLVVSGDDILAADIGIYYGWAEANNAAVTPNGGNVSLTLRGMEHPLRGSVPPEGAEDAVAAAAALLEDMGLTGVPEDDYEGVFPAYEPGTFARYVLGLKGHGEHPYGVSNSSLYVRASELAAAYPVDSAGMYDRSPAKMRAVFRDGHNVLWHGRDPKALTGLIGRS